MGADSPRPLGLRVIEALGVGAQDKGGRPRARGLPPFVLLTYPGSGYWVLQKDRSPAL